jgi:hypothetical protein
MMRRVCQINDDKKGPPNLVRRVYLINFTRRATQINYGEKGFQYTDDETGSQPNDRKIIFPKNLS